MQTIAGATPQPLKQSALHSQWYNETFNFAYNLENGFCKQTFKFSYFLWVEKVIHGKLWRGGRGGFIGILS